ncbi:hypothetical protein [uncultured Ruminococcus sp.]|uniref:hypothetical protein n=1 Tax=uncultured Ruminococcus sp. TaxID=165186 RepID=UPI0035C696FF
MKGQTQRLPLYYEHPQPKSLFSVTVTHLSATATAAVVVVTTIVAAAAEDDDKKNDPSTAIAVSVSEKVTHTLSSFRLHYHIITKS